MNLTTWIKRNTGPMIVGAAFVMFGAILFGLKMIGSQGATIQRLAEQGKVRDQQAAEQRQLQHECSLPAVPGQHKPEPKVHVHKCWDDGLGAIIASMQRAVNASESTSNFIAGCLNPEGECGKLAATQRAQERAVIQTKLDALRTQVAAAQEELLRKTTFVVTNPNRPGDVPLLVRPVVGSTPIPPACIKVGNVEVLPGVVQCKGTP